MLSTLTRRRAQGPSLTTTPSASVVVEHLPVAVIVLEGCAQVSRVRADR